VPRPKTGVTPVRNVRIAEQLWRDAQAAAALRGETMTAVIERALRRYVMHGDPDVKRDDEA
jgi:hypothetical protein